MPRLPRILNIFSPFLLGTGRNSRHGSESLTLAPEGIRDSNVIEKVLLYVWPFMDRYETLHVIGKGSFGKALLCRDKQTNQKVVMKVIDLGSQPEHVQAASLQEAKILRAVDHPNVISYVDSFMDGGNLCIVMEYAAGGDLWGKITAADGHHFPEAQIVEWVKEMCSALEYIHSIHILHRDIKSQNMFLDAEGHVKLGDFGIAKILNNTDDFAQTIVGSPFYLSPEICQGTPYDAKTDIWSLGCVIYELCTLSPAFSGNNMGSVVMKIMRQKQDPIPSSYSQDLADLVDWMLQKNPEDRPTLQQILASRLLSGEEEEEYVSDELEKLVIEEKHAAPAVIKSTQKHVIEKRPPAKAMRRRQTKPSGDIAPALKVVALAPDAVTEKPVAKRASVKPPPVVPPVRKKPQPHVRDGAKVDKCLMVKNLNNNKPQTVSKVTKKRTKRRKKQEAIPELERCCRIDQMGLSRDATNMRMYLESLIGQEKFNTAYEAINEGEKSEKEILDMVGGEGHERLVVLIRRLILSEEQLCM